TRARVSALIGLTPPKRSYVRATTCKRSGGTSRPRVTFWRKGATSSGPSGPPKDTTTRPSYTALGVCGGLLHIDERAGARDAHVALGAVAEQRNHGVPHPLGAALWAIGLLARLDGGVTGHCEPPSRAPPGGRRVEPCGRLATVRPGPRPQASVRCRAGG